MVKRCRGPVNRLLMLRKRGLGGPVFQNVGGGVCAKSVGAYLDENAPGSGVRPTGGWTGLQGCLAPLNLGQLRDFLVAEGHTVASTQSAITVDGMEFLLSYLSACDYTGIPGPIRHDLCDGMKAQGFCLGGNCT